MQVCVGALQEPVDLLGRQRDLLGLRLRLPQLELPEVGWMKGLLAMSPSRLPKSNMRFTGTTSRLTVRASTPASLRSRTNCDMNL